MDLSEASKEHLQEKMKAIEEELNRREKVATAKSELSEAAEDFFSKAQMLATLTGTEKTVVIRGLLPDEVIDLVAFGGAKQVEAWKPALDINDAYAVGDRVVHKGKIFVSKVTENTYEPGTYPGGWEEEA